ncbi:MAG TPA: DUF167 domain-containing protein [Candidatus Kryptonia bacterium]|nr:DUF167 domain-containing protein [Candidatus Kryptonia bacterium]
MSAPLISPVPGGLRVRVRVQPRAPRNRILGHHGDALKAQVTAPPVDGEANAALERLVAAAAGVPRSTVRVVSGAKSRDKVIEVATQDVAKTIARLERLADASAPKLR